MRRVAAVRLILVRHGLSEWNAVGRLQGVSDTALSPGGRREARDLGPLVAAMRPEAAVSSDLRRAVDTLELMGLGVVAMPPDPRWRESDLGDWTGHTPTELSPDDHAAFLRWRVGRETPPGGEAWDDTCARVLAASRDLAASGAGSVVVVTHGGPVRAACEVLAGLDPTAMVPVANATVTVLETDPVPHLVAFGVSPVTRPAERHGG